jgi:hypothetical protein
LRLTCDDDNRRPAFGFSFTAVSAQFSPSFAACEGMHIVVYG